MAADPGWLGLMKATRRHMLIALASGIAALPGYGQRTPLEAEFMRLFGARRITAGAFDLDISQVVENGNSVAVRLAADASDPPAAFHLFAPRNPEPFAATFRFGSTALPEIATRLRLSMTQNVTAVAEWPDGRLAQRAVSVLVTLGACIDENFERWVRAAPNARAAGTGTTTAQAARVARADADARQDEPGAGFGTVRLRVDQTADAGARIDVRTLVRHPMETGYRIDTRGERVPRNVVEHFHCALDDEPLLDADLRPAIAADPYMAFAFQPRRGGTLQFTWREDRGAMHREERPLEVRGT